MDASFRKDLSPEVARPGKPGIWRWRWAINIGFVLVVWALVYYVVFN